MSFAAQHLSHEHTHELRSMCVRMCVCISFFISEKNVFITEHVSDSIYKWYYAVSWWFRRLSEARIESTSVNEVTNEKQTKKSLIIIAVATTTTHQNAKKLTLGVMNGRGSVSERNKLCWWQNDDDKLKLTVAGKEVSEWMRVLRRKATDPHLAVRLHSGGVIH